MTETTLVLEKQNDRIATIILNKPNRRNALDHLMMDDLVELLEGLEKDNEVKVIIIKGQGEHFSAGGDLKMGVEHIKTIEDSRMAMRNFLRVVRTLTQMEKPVIAMVKGYAVSGGMGLAMACDIIFASEDAKFCSNFLKVGITPELGAMLIMPQVMGIYRAKELWYTGRVVEASEAKEMGFVNRIYPSDQIDEATMEFARGITQMPQVPLRITKRITNSTMLGMLNQVLEAEVQSTPFCSQTEEHKEYMRLFNKK